MIKKITLALLITFGGILLLGGCTEETDHGKVWPPDTRNDDIRATITKIYPEANSMDPDSVAFVGVGYIYIEGQGFSANPEDDRVYFNGERGDVVEASSTKLKVKIPVLSADSVTVHVSVKGQLKFASYKGQDFFFPLRVKSATAVFKAIDEFTDATGLAVDSQDRLYILTTDKKILQLVHPDSVAKEYATSTFITTPCMRVGPDGALYLTRGIKSFYRVEEGGKTTKIVSAKTKVSYFDFDEDLNIYAGGKGGTIDLIRPDLTVKTVANYPDYYINSLRVYDGYVYVAVSYQGSDSTVIQEGIYKNRILADSLGANELVFDWKSFAGRFGPEIQSITFDEDGEMFIGLSAAIPGDNKAVYKLNEGAYLYTEVLKVPATILSWGQGSYLYINHRPDNAKDRAIIQVELPKFGAPYFGRP